MESESKGKRVRVLVADNEPIWRHGLVSALASFSNVDVAGHGNADAALIQRLLDIRPDVLILDVDVTDESGSALLMKTKDACPDMPVLVFTHQDRQDSLFQAIALGASGFLPKTAEVDDLLEAIRAMASGQVFLGPRMTSQFVRDFINHVRSMSDGKATDGLTGRESEVFEMLARGHTNAEIARELFLSPHTVRTYRQRIMQKLGFHSRVELVTYALMREFRAAANGRLGHREMSVVQRTVR